MGDRDRGLHTAIVLLLLLAFFQNGSCFLWKRRVPKSDIESANGRSSGSSSGSSSCSQSSSSSSSVTSEGRKVCSSSASSSRSSSRSTGSRNGSEATSGSSSSFRWDLHPNNTSQFFYGSKKTEKKEKDISKPVRGNLSVPTNMPCEHCKPCKKRSGSKRCIVNNKCQTCVQLTVTARDQNSCQLTCLSSKRRQ